MFSLSKDILKKTKFRMCHILTMSIIFLLTILPSPAFAHAGGMVLPLYFMALTILVTLSDAFVIKLFNRNRAIYEVLSISIVKNLIASTTIVVVGLPIFFIAVMNNYGHLLYGHLRIYGVAATVLFMVVCSDYYYFKIKTRDDGFPATGVLKCIAINTISKLCVYCILQIFLQLIIYR